MAKEPKTDHNTQRIIDSFHSFAEEHEALNKKYRVPYSLQQKDLKDWPRGKVGDVIFYNPEIPNNPKEAFELFKNYYAAVQCALHKHRFIETYKTANKASIKAEIAELEKWIDEANKESYTEACKTPHSSNKQHEYLRLTNGFYDEYLMTWIEHQDASIAASVYGEYILFYDYLKGLLHDALLNPPQIEILLKNWPELNNLITQPLEYWFELSYNARVEIFGTCSTIEHCKREIPSQKRSLEEDIEKSHSHKDFNQRLIFQAVAKRREEFIDYLEDMLEEASYPEIPFIGKLFSSNLNISETILDAYHSIVPQPSKDNELPDNYIGKRHRYNKPYTVIVYGAYALAKDWEQLEYKRKNKIAPYDTITDKEVEIGLRDFARGFKRGYYQFDKDFLCSDNATVVLTNIHLARKVFDYVTGSFFGRGGYPISVGMGNLLCEWYNSGMEAGRYYRAWYIIIDNYSVFEAFFVKTEQPQNTPSYKKTGLYIKPGIIEQLYSILKDFFSERDHEHLNQLLNNPDFNSGILTINTSGNRLADTFKQLYEADMILNCQKRELEDWIKERFQFTHRNEVKEFTSHYLNDVISTNKDKCQKPIINIKKDKETGDYKIERA